MNHLKFSVSRRRRAADCPPHLAFFAWFRSFALTPPAQSRQKPQQSRLIKPHQGKRSKSPFGCLAYFAVNLPCLPEIREPRPKPDFLPLCDFATPRLCVNAASSSHDQASIKAKKPAIKANRASSRQTMKFLYGAVGRVTPCAPSWRTQTRTLAGIVPVNPGFLVGRRRRAEDCPPYLAFPLLAMPPQSQVSVWGRESNR